MNYVLDGRLNDIAYMPLDSFIQRIIGRETYNIIDLKKITEFSICPKNDDAVIVES